MTVAKPSAKGLAAIADLKVSDWVPYPGCPENLGDPIQSPSGSTAIS